MSTISNKISIKGKKRSRIAFASHKRPGPEIKKVNMFFNPVQEGNNLYSAMIWVPFQKNIPQNRTDMQAAYVAKWMRDIDQGTGSYQRIGDSVRIRQILFKGYVEVRTNLMTQCRVRVYFIREMNRATTTTALFNNVEQIDSSTQDASGQISHMKHNFYKMCNNYDVLNKDTSIQKIMEFNLTPYVSPYNGAQTQGSPTSQTWTTFEKKKVYAEPAYCLPINKVVTLNENYTIGSDHYGLLVTCDEPYAASTTQLITDLYPTYTDASLLHPWSLNFFSLVYYTDA